MILEIIIIGMLAGMCWASDKRLDHLEDYINTRISNMEEEIIMNKGNKH